MKRVKSSFIIVATLILNFNLVFSQNNGFDPLDPLGPEYGKINQPRLDSRSFEPFEGDKLKNPEINFPDYDNQDGSTSKWNSQNKKSDLSYHNSNYSAKSTNDDNINYSEQEFNEISSEMRDNAREAMRSNNDPNQYAKIQSYDPEAYNYDRFANSPCFDKIGFSPTWDMESLEKQYSDCESEHNLKKTMNILYIFIFTVIVGIVIFYSLPKDKREVLINKLPKFK